MAKKSKNRKRQNVAVSALTYGKIINPPRDPPMISSIPNFKLTVQNDATISSDSGEYYLFVSDLYKFIFDAYGGVGNLLISIKSIMVYNMTVGHALTVNFRECLEDGEGKNSSIRTIRDYGTPLTYAKVGFKYPMSISTVFHGPNDKQKTVLNVLAEKGDRLLFSSKLIIRLLPTEKSYTPSVYLRFV